MKQLTSRDLPRDNLVRALFPGTSLARDAGEAEANDGRIGTMHGHFARFNEWAEIDSVFEGHFMERFLHGSFEKTLSERRSKIKPLFQHGRDPNVGMKVLGPVNRLEEDEEGPAYEVALLDTAYNRELLPGLKAGLYGSSFKFRIVHDDFVQRPRRSEHNPNGIPERSIREAMVFEFGPVTFPAYEGASAEARMRSLTDEFMLERLVEHPHRLQALAERSGISLVGLALPASEGETDEAAADALEAIGTVGVGEQEQPILDMDALRERSEREATAATTRLYERCVSYVTETPWAVHIKTLATIRDILTERRNGIRPSREEIAARIGTRSRPDDDEAAAKGPVAVIRMWGPIMPHGDTFEDVSSGAMTPMEGFQKRLKAALDDDSVKSILLNVDSPGGSVELVPETAELIRAGRKAKPIVAVANTWMASAAYFLGSQATEVIVTPSGEVGSIGVYSAHLDISEAMEMAGEKLTLVKAGKFKAETNPWEPLSEEAAAEMQRKVDAYYEMFLSAVSKGRGVSVANVRANFGQGRMVMATEAVEAGMADGVATFEETLARLEKAADKPAGRAAGSDDDQAAEAREPGADEPDADAGVPPGTEPEPSEATTPADEQPESPEATTADPAPDAAERSAPEQPSTEESLEMKTIEEKKARIAAIQADLRDLDSQFAGQALPQADAERWKELEAELEELQVDVSEAEARGARLRELAGDTAASASARESVAAGFRGGRMATEGDLFDLSTIRFTADDPAAMTRAVRDRAMKVIDQERFSAFPEVAREKCQEHIERLLKSADVPDGSLARHIVITGSPLYQRAFQKAITRSALTDAEARTLESVRALATFSGAAGGFAVPYTLDPTVIPTSDGVANPLRAISRVEQIVGNEWRGVTSAGVTAQYDSEAAEVDDNSPTLVQPTVVPERVHSFVPFSIEIDQDWGGLGASLAAMFREAKDELEAVKFLRGAGHGSTEPEGLLTGLTNTQRVPTATGNSFATEDLYAVTDALPERHESNARILGHRATFSKVRQFDTQGGADLWVRLGAGTPPELLGYPAHRTSEMDSAIASGQKILIVGNFSRFLIVDRVGMSVDFVPHLFGANRRPTGQRGLYAFWRNSSVVLDDNAFRFLEVDAT